MNAEDIHVGHDRELPRRQTLLAHIKLISAGVLPLLKSHVPNLHKTPFGADWTSLAQFDSGKPASVGAGEASVGVSVLSSSGGLAIPAALRAFCSLRFSAFSLCLSSR